MQFLDFYHVSYESDEKYAPSANINKNGIVSLSVLNKDGRGIIWDGESFLLQHFQKTWYTVLESRRYHYMLLPNFFPLIQANPSFHTTHWNVMEKKSRIF